MTGSSFFHGPGTERDRRLQRRVTAWELVWALTVAVAALTVARGWLDTTTPVVVVAALLSALPGVGMLFAYRRSLRQADELRRKIELDAMALALGVGLVSGFALWIMEIGGLIDDAVGWVVVAIGLTYVTGLVLGCRRFR